MTVALEVENVTKRYGGIAAVDDCCFSVGEGTLSGLIGPNGSGKTTLLNIASGYLRADTGHVTPFGRRLNRSSPSTLYRLGLSRTFQRARTFGSITVRQNLLVSVPRRGWSILRCGAESEVNERADHLLESFRLQRHADVQAGELSYGQQKLLEFAMALMAKPRMLLLDEPTAGVNHVLIDTMVERIQELHAGGMTVLIVEHNMEFVMSLCDPIYVLDHGKLLFSGSPEAVQQNELVLEAYLGD